MKEININFCDYWDGFDVKNNGWINILKKLYHVTLSDTPDFLIYSCFGREHTRYNNCIRIFFTGENVRPDFLVCDYAIGFDYLTFEDRYLRHCGSFPTSTTIQQRADLNSALAQRKFCNFIYSNAGSGEVAEPRQNFCKQGNPPIFSSGSK